MYVEGGSVLLPSGEEVAVSDFEISRSEVTVQQYVSCIQAGYCTGIGGPNHLAEKRHHPVNTNYAESSRFAEWVGGTLPSTAQWAYAATDGGQRYEHDPEIPDCELGDTKLAYVNIQWHLIHSCRGEGTSSVYSYPRGDNALGLTDLFGNVSEWTNESTGQQNQRVIGLNHSSRGLPDSFNQSGRRLTLIITDNYSRLNDSYYIGFRPVRPAKSWRRQRLPVVR